MIHLTITGYEAGRPLCDCDKAQELAKGNEFAHAMYFPFGAPWVETKGGVCPACQAIFDEVEQEQTEAEESAHANR